MLEKIKFGANGLPLRILFQDEGRFGRISDYRRCWAPLPTRPIAKSQIIREYVYALAAICPIDGKMSSLVMPYVDAKIMSVFLKHTANLFPTNYCVMIMDAAGWHRANELTIPKNMCLIYLPPYSPELNPVEHLWSYVRNTYFGNKTFDSLGEVVDKLCFGLNELHKQTEVIKSMSCFDWLKLYV